MRVGEVAHVRESDEVGAPFQRSAQTAVRLMRALTRYSPWHVALVTVMTVGVSFTSGVGLVMLVPFLQLAGLDVGAGSIGSIADFAAEGFATVGLQPTVPAVIAAYLVVVVSGAALKRAQAVHTTMLYQGFVMSLRRSVYRALTNASWTYSVRQKDSNAVHVLTQELERVGGAAAAMVRLLVRTATTAVYLTIALWVSTWTTVLVLGCGGALALLLSRKTRLGRMRGEAVSSAYEALYETITEQLAGMRITKSHGLEEHHVRQFAKRADSTAGSLTAVVRNQAEVSFWLESGSAAILAGIFYVSLVTLGLPLASILLLLYVFARLVPMVTGLQQSVHRMLDLLPAFDRVSGFLNRLEAHAEPSAPALELAPLARDVRFEAVSYSYGSANEPVLHDVNLSLRAGTTTAIVGPSGAGKSTLADLAVGLVTPSGGVVRIDGRALDGATARAWRRQIGYVNQDTFLFHDSIRENLRLVDPEVSDEEILAALADASADFVHNLPQGLDTIVGDRGVRLSGGERQRISLARALIRRPSLLVLDEATSALDPENEEVILRAIDRMAGRQTILLIAHRLSTVRSADHLYVLDAGRIVESGTWDQLFRDVHGRFHALCRAQGLVTERAIGDRESTNHRP